MKPMCFGLLALCVAGSAAQAQQSPFVGDWKLDPAKSKQVDEMKVASLGGNKFSFDFGGGDPEICVADGTDQPGHFGIEIAVSIEPEKWTVVRKKDGKVLVTGVWTLGKDSNTLHDHFTAVRPDGKMNTTDYVYERRGDGQGFIGDWVSTTQAMNSAFVMIVKPFEGEGLSFVTSGGAGTKNVKLDGKDYANVDAVVNDMTASARQVDERTLELTDKIGGKAIDTQDVSVSQDGKTLTMTVHVVGRSEPDVMVFEKQ